MKNTILILSLGFAVWASAWGGELSAATTTRDARPARLIAVTAALQAAAPNEILSETLLVRLLCKDGSPARGRRLLFSIISGKGALLKGNGDFKRSRSLRMVSDEDGLSEVFFATPPEVGQETEVQVSVEGFPALATIWKIRTVDQRKPPSSARNLTIAENPPYDEVLNWEDCSENESGFLVERSEGGGNWKVIAVLPANSTTYTDHVPVPDSVYFYRICTFSSDLPNTELEGVFEALESAGR